METDKRPFYIWIMVLLINIGTVLSIVLINIPDSGWGNFGWYTLLEDLSINLIILGISLFVSIVSILIAKSNSRLKNYFGYGIPVLLLLPLPYFIQDYFICTGKFCQLGAIIFGFGFGLSAVIFAIFYTIGIYARKLNIKFILSVIWIEIILFIGSALYFGLN